MAIQNQLENLNKILDELNDYENLYDFGSIITKKIDKADKASEATKLAIELVENCLNSLTSQSVNDKEIIREQISQLLDLIAELRKMLKSNNCYKIEDSEFSQYYKDKLKGFGKNDLPSKEDFSNMIDVYKKYAQDIARYNSILKNNKNISDNSYALVRLIRSTIKLTSSLILGFCLGAIGLTLAAALLSVAAVALLSSTVLDVINNKSNLMGNNILAKLVRTAVNLVAGLTLAASTVAVIPLLAVTLLAFSAAKLFHSVISRITDHNSNLIDALNRNEAKLRSGVAKNGIEINSDSEKSTKLNDEILHKPYIEEPTAGIQFSETRARSLSELTASSSDFDNSSSLYRDRRNNI